MNKRELLETLMPIVAVAFGMSIWGSVSRTLADNNLAISKGMTREQARQLCVLIVSNAVVSAFCGSVAMFLLIHMNVSWGLIAALTGVAGWMGSGFMTMLLMELRKRYLKDGSNDKQTDVI